MRIKTTLLLALVLCVFGIYACQKRKNIDNALAEEQTLQQTTENSDLMSGRNLNIWSPLFHFNLWAYPLEATAGGKGLDIIRWISGTTFSSQFETETLKDNKIIFPEDGIYKITVQGTYSFQSEMPIAQLHLFGRVHEFRAAAHNQSLFNIFYVKKKRLESSSANYLIVCNGCDDKARLRIENMSVSIELISIGDQLIDYNGKPLELFSASYQIPDKKDVVLDIDNPKPPIVALTGNYEKEYTPFSQNDPYVFQRWNKNTMFAYPYTGWYLIRSGYLAVMTGDKQGQELASKITNLSISNVHHAIITNTMTPVDNITSEQICYTFKYKDQVEEIKFQIDTPKTMLLVGRLILDINYLQENDPNNPPQLQSWIKNCKDIN